MRFSKRTSTSHRSSINGMPGQSNRDPEWQPETHADGVSARPTCSRPIRCCSTSTACMANRCSAGEYHLDMRRPPDPKTGYPTQVNCWPLTASATPRIMSRASATVRRLGRPQFRDFAVMMNEDLKMNGLSPGSRVETSAVNYGTEPTYFRFGRTDPGQFATSGGVDCTVSNTLPLAGQPATTPLLSGDPKTPIFTALAGMPTRFRMLHPRNRHRAGLHTQRSRMAEDALCE